MTYKRYAVYFVPPAGAEWVEFATHWLGWNPETGTCVAHPVFGGLDVAAVTEVPRKYGLHATMKPPFHLHNDQSFDSLCQACAQLASTHPPVTLDGMEIVRMGRFLALRPVGREFGLNRLAAACVQELDRFRAPASDAELTLRRAARLTPEQDANLVQWGYPYVLDAFRFHLTLTGKLDKATLNATQSELGRTLSPLLPAPFRIAELALMGEAQNGYFHLIHRYALSG